MSGQNKSVPGEDLFSPELAGSPTGREKILHERTTRTRTCGRQENGKDDNAA
jgi:hypothetical protein